MKSNKASIPGSQKEYVVSENTKRYTMKDNAFKETKNGNFQYERKLSTVPSDKNAPIIKISVNKEMDTLKIKTVSSNGLKKINLYKSDNYEKPREFAEYILKSLADENVLEEV